MKWTLELLKAALTPIAILALCVTAWMSLRQVDHIEQNRTVEQFDKVLERFASPEPRQRIAGTLGLRLFLSKEQKAYHGQVLAFLVNELAIEDAPEVRTALLETLRQASDVEPPNEALRVAVGHSRRLTTEALRVSIAGQAEAPADEALDAYLAALPPRANVPQIPARLVALAEAIQRLVALGARTDDMAGIYCEGCDFSQAHGHDLSGTLFDDSYLKNANFSSLNLRKASFRNADLRGVLFTSANLAGADLSVSRPAAEKVVLAGDEDLPFPLLECADLRGADLGGLPLSQVQIRFEPARTVVSAATPRMFGAVVDSATRLGTLGVTAEITVPDALLPTAGADKAPSARALRDRLREVFIDSPARSFADVVTSDLYSPFDTPTHAKHLRDPKGSTSTFQVGALDSFKPRLPGRDRIARAVLPLMRASLDQPPLFKLGILADLQLETMTGEKPTAAVCHGARSDLVVRHTKTLEAASE